MNEMKHISPLQAGYLVRKNVKGKLKTRFFSAGKAGSMEQALSAAKVYRDELVAQSEGSVSYQQENSANKTGYVGVAMHCRSNASRSSGVVHFFRAQVPMAGGKSKSKSWAISRFGLLGAYVEAVRWRRTQMGELPPSLEEIQAVFAKDFLPLYMKHARDETELDERLAMTSSLEGLYNTTTEPNIKKMLREGLRRLKNNRNLMVVSTNDSPVKPKSLLDEARQSAARKFEAV